MPHCPRPARSGFTLIELLVVIGIIAVIAAITVPAIASARQTAQSTVTLQRLGQLSTVANLYATDHRDRVWTAQNWLKTIEGDTAQPGVLLDGGYLTDDEILECAVNGRRLPYRDSSGHVPTPPPGLYDHAEVDSDFAFVHQVEGARLGLHTQFAYHRDPTERGWSGGVWLEDETALVNLPGVPIFVEENPAFYHARDEMLTFKGFDQLDRRHDGGGTGKSLMAFLDGHAESTAPPADDSPEGLEVSDLTAAHFYLSARGGRWRAMTLSSEYEYGWVNDPR
ncbi:MAG: prepilin-type N-terminal cleavage/methylation domain-containing protein [Phycisphaerales bacterium]|jgi:prepilin-type N-terminal cleavage/methylation domain-containing protein